VVPEGAVSRVREVAREHGAEAWPLGRVVKDERKRVWLRPAGLVGEGEEFTPG